MCYIPPMSRPSGPLFSWATNLNYPAGSDPWAGTAIKVLPPSPAGGFVPGQAAAGEYVNYVFNQAFTTLQNVTDGLGQGEVLTFKDAGFTNTYKPTYDPVANRWVASASLGAGDFPYVSYDTGWTTMGAWPTGTSSKPILGSNPAGMVVGVDGTAGKGFSLPTGSNTWSNWTLPSVANTFREVSWLASGSTFIAIGVNGTPVMFKSTGAANWTNATSSIPGALNALSTHWTCAASPTRFVAIPRNATTGGNYMTSDDGVTFTLRTSLPNAANFAGRAVHYNAVEGLWMYVSLFTNFSANQISVYTSPDAITWTLKFTGGSLNWEVWDLSSAGSVWCMLVNRDVGLTLERSTLLYSVDSGVSWHVTDTGNLNTAGGVDPPRNQIVSDGNRFMWNANDKLYVGLHSCGLKTAVT